VQIFACGSYRYREPTASAAPAKQERKLCKLHSSPANSFFTTFSFLPGVDVEVLLTEEGDHDCAVGEFPTCQRGERLLSRSRLFILDVNLANASTLPATSGSRHLGVEDFAVLGTFLLDILEDF
jgi:hypothetical protein